MDNPEPVASSAPTVPRSTRSPSQQLSPPGNAGRERSQTLSKPGPSQRLSGSAGAEEDDHSFRQGQMMSILDSQPLLAYDPNRKAEGPPVDQWLESLGGDYEVDDQGPDVLEVKERELAEAKLKNLELQTRLSEAQDKVFKEQSEKENLAKKTQEVEAQLEEANQKLQAAQIELETRAAALSAVSNELAAAQERVNVINHERDNLNKAMEEREVALKKLTEERNKSGGLDLVSKTKQVQALEQEAEAAKKALAAKDEELNRLKGSVESLAVQRVQREKEALEAQKNAEAFNTDGTVTTTVVTTERMIEKEGAPTDGKPGEPDGPVGCTRGCSNGGTCIVM